MKTIKMDMMKKGGVILFLSLLMTAVSCTEDKTEQPTSEPDTVPAGFESRTFTAEIMSFTRADLSGARMLWSEGDRIAVYDGTRKNEFTVQSVNNESAVFEGLVTEGSEEFYAVYPYSAASETLPDADGVLTVEVPSTQRVGSRAVDPDAVVSIARADGVNHFQFRNVVSLVKIHVPEGAESVLFKPANAGEKISGSCSAAVGKMAEGADGASVTLTSDTEGEALEEGDYWVAAVPCTLTEGYSVSFSNAEQESSVDSSEELELTRSSFIDLTATTAAASWVNIFIRTADDLVSFSKNQLLTSADLVRLGNDIDLSGVDWAPFRLACRFDGAGHKIYNLQVTSASTAAFVSELAEGAVLENLTIGSSDGENWDGTSAISLSGDGGIQAGVVGTSAGTIRNVRNFASIQAETAGSPSREIRIGGIVATNDGAVSTCENYGAISVTGSNTGKYVFVGGIVGWGSTKSTLVEKSVNRGTMYIENPQAQAGGGIVGMHQGGNIESCDNYGKTTIKQSVNEVSYFGGIVGFVQNYWGLEVGIRNCRNFAGFDSDNSNVRSLGGIAAIVHRTGTASVIIDGCSNEAEVSLSKHATSSIWNAVGGIVGMVDANSGGFTGKNYVQNCTNSGDVFFEESRDLTASDGQQSAAGGIVGWACHQTVISGCTNTGAVSSTKLSINYVGGIAGYAYDATEVSDCTNEAPVTLRLNTANGLTWAGKRAGVGGICGFIQHTVALSGNTNSGAVTLDANAASVCAVGGIVGVSDATASRLTGNTNRGKVSSTSPLTHKAAGGLVGYVYNGITFDGNANYGDVYATGDKTSDIFAGGLIGFIDSPSKVVSRGDISNCTVESKVRAGALFSALINNANASASFTDCKIGGKVIGLIADATTGEHTITSENLEKCAYSYVGGSATYTLSGLTLAE